MHKLSAMAESARSDQIFRAQKLKALTYHRRARINPRVGLWLGYYQPSGTKTEGKEGNINMLWEPSCISSRNTASPSCFSARLQTAAIDDIVLCSRQAKGVPLFPCMDCSCSFKKLGSLNAHISKMHITVIEVPTSTAVREFTTQIVCPVVFFLFTLGVSLKLMSALKKRLKRDDCHCHRLLFVCCLFYIDMNLFIVCWIAVQYHFWWFLLTPWIYDDLLWKLHE